MFGSKKIGFVDLAQLRFGVFKKMVRNGDKLTIEYLPPNSFKTKKIKNILDWSVKEVECFEDESPFSHFMVLVAGENGDSPFVDKYLSDNGILVNLIRRMNSLNEESRISRATMKTKLREDSRGESAVIKRVTEHMKTVEDATKKDFPFSKQRRSLY